MHFVVRSIINKKNPAPVSPEGDRTGGNYIFIIFFLIVFKNCYGIETMSENFRSLQ